MCPMENVWFFFISIVWLYFSHKTEKFWFWKSLKYFIIFWEKNIWSQIWIYPMKNVWFCFISIVWVHFSHKTKFWFWKPLKYFICLIKKWCQIWICHDVKNDVKQCLIWFKLLCLRSILATSWDLRILKFIEIV